MIKETYNLIILDRSGSMMSIRNEAIAGVNETFGTIRKIRRDNDVAQKVTFASFCSCRIDTIYDNTPIEEVKPITARDYEPCCCTPLYDAIGNCCTRLKKQIATNSECAVSVTIITDGYENASKEWSSASVKKLIETLKAEGWLFAYIGANQNLEEVRYNLSIDNTLAFETSEEGTQSMFAKERKARTKWMSSMTDSCILPTEASNCGYFDCDD